MSTPTDQLRQLEKEILKHDWAATKGPWMRDDYAYPPERTVCDRDCIIVATVTNENSRDPEGQRIEQEANLDFIAFARTALLDLLAVAKGMEAQLVMRDQTIEYQRGVIQYSATELAALRAVAKGLEKFLADEQNFKRWFLKSFDWNKVNEEHHALVVKECTSTITETEHTRLEELQALVNLHADVDAAFPVESASETLIDLQGKTIDALRAENEQGIKERVMLMHALMGINALPHSAEIDAIMDKALDSIEALASPYPNELRSCSQARNMNS